jgi:hypothetical protein
VQHAMVANGDSNAGRGEPEQEMMPPQGNGNVMALIVLLAERFRSQLVDGVGVVLSTHGSFISMPISCGRQACG